MANSTSTSLKLTVKQLENSELGVRSQIQTY